MGTKKNEYDSYAPDRNDLLIEGGQIIGLTFGLLERDGVGVMRDILQEAVECHRDADAFVKTVLSVLVGMCDAVDEINEVYGHGSKH